MSTVTYVVGLVLGCEPTWADDDKRSTACATSACGKRCEPTWADDDRNLTQGDLAELLKLRAHLG